MPTELKLDIQAELDPQQAKDVCMTYSGKIADSGLLLIEFDAENPNIFALQTAISCKRSLEAVSRFAGFGPIAQKALGETLKANLKPKVPA